MFGPAFFVPLLSWLVSVTWYAWAALAVAEALIFAVLTVAQRLLLDLRAWPTAVADWWAAPRRCAAATGRGDLARELHRPESQPEPARLRRGRRHRPPGPGRRSAAGPTGATPASCGCPAAVHVKRQLVPFGEYIPFRGLLSRLTPLTALQPHDFTPGHRPVVFRAGKVRLGDVICYEAGFDDLVRPEVTAGANLLAVQSNDATFEAGGRADETGQQLAMARIRAVESDRAVVCASTTGVSAIIAPDGSVIARRGIWERAVLEARVPLRTSITPAERAGPWPETVITALTIAALAAARRAPRGPRGR